MNKVRQIEIHSAAYYFGARTESPIVIFTNKPERLVAQYPAETLIFIVFNPFKPKIKKALRGLHPNIRLVNIFSLRKKFLADKVMVYIDCLDESGIFPRVLVRLAITRSRLARISLVTARSTSTRNFNILKSLNQRNKTTLIGHAHEFVDSSQKNILIALVGQYTNIPANNTPPIKVLAILHVFNEEDVIASTVKHLKKQGLDVHVIDNWSTDNTYSIVKYMARKSDWLTYERYPIKPNNAFELEKMLRRVEAVAQERKEYSWVTINDADEIRWSPWPGVTLQSAIAFIDQLGFTAIDYTVFNFIPTKEGFNSEHDLVDFFRHGEFSKVSGHFVQIKTWKNVAGAEIASSGGHHVHFVNQKIFPLKFLLGHYPIRSTKHAMTKIFKERRERYSKAERNKGWHVHYDDLDKKMVFTIPASGLINFYGKDFNDEFILERLTGVGIEREDS